MKTTQLAMLGWILNGAIDSGKFEHVSVEDVYSRIENGTIIDLLDEVLEGDDHGVNFKEEHKAELKNKWETHANVFAPSDLKVERNGLNLLLAYVLEDMQQSKN